MTARLLPHLQALVGERYPVTEPEPLIAVEHDLVAQFAAMGSQVPRHSFESSYGAARNVIAIHDSPSGSAGLSTLLIGGHYIAVPGSLGADDNASASAVLLEAVHVLKDASFNRPFRFVAFCLEEQGLVGSTAYGRHG